MTRKVRGNSTERSKIIEWHLIIQLFNRRNLYSSSLIRKPWACIKGGERQEEKSRPKRALPEENKRASAFTCGRTSSSL